MTLHLALHERIGAHYAAALAAPIEPKHDALLVRLRNDVVVELRFAGRDEYTIGWRWGDAELRIDTAPLHSELATFPNHLHDAQGALVADTLTQPGRDAWDNVRAVIDALLVDPLLRAKPARA